MDAAIMCDVKLTAGHKYFKALLRKNLTDILRKPNFDGLIG
jgi:hypothetical protein